jgi:uncharacterized protein (TIGR00369 family)
MSHEPTNPLFIEEIKESFGRQSVMRLIGAELGIIEPGVVEINLAYRPDLVQQNGYIHAGIVTTIVDSACGYAAFSLMPAGSSVLSVEFKMNLLRPARGLRFLAHGEVIKAGRTLTIVRGDVFGFSDDGKKEHIATMQATMMGVVRDRS